MQPWENYRPPAGMRLLKSEYAAGECRHVLGPDVEGGPRYLCVVLPGEDELRTLEKFGDRVVAGEVEPFEGTAPAVLEPPTKPGKKSAR